MKNILLIIAIAIVFAGLGIYAASQLYGQATTQEKGIKQMDTTNVVWKIVRDTVYIDRSRPINKPWYSYEIESGEDSIYLYSGRELIKALSREQATVFAIDSLIILDNL